MSEKRSSQKGLTLIELLVAMVVGAMIIGAVVASIIQLFTMSDRNSDYNAAFTQVQNAGYWVSHDAVQITEEPTFDNGNLVTLDWVDGDGDAHQVVYTLQDADPADGVEELQRAYSFEESGVPQPEETIVIAQYIDPANTSCSWDGNVLTLVIMAQVGDQTVSRTYKVEPRPLEPTPTPPP